MGNQCHQKVPTKLESMQRAHTIPLKILLMVRGLSPCREPFPPSRLKPNPAEVFSSVTVQTVASASEENAGTC